MIQLLLNTDLVMHKLIALVLVTAFLLGLIFFVRMVIINYYKVRYYERVLKMHRHRIHESLIFDLDYLLELK